MEDFIKFLNESFGNEKVTFTFERLKVRYRINRVDGQRSVYCFVNFDGNILFPASWKTPTRSQPIRGHIINDRSCCQRYSIKYLRG